MAMMARTLSSRLALLEAAMRERRRELLVVTPEDGETVDEALLRLGYDEAALAGRTLIVVEYVDGTPIDPMER